jgi:hypothetical protein
VVSFQYARYFRLRAVPFDAFDAAHERERAK